MVRLSYDAEIFNLIVRIIEDESRTKSQSIELVRKLLKITEEDAN